jgi:hypothetical protein
MRVWFETNTTVVCASVIVTVILSVPLPISLLTLGYDEPVLRHDSRRLAFLSRLDSTVIHRSSVDCDFSFLSFVTVPYASCTLPDI